jgi:hypothetical protein
MLRGGSSRGTVAKGWAQPTSSTYVNVANHPTEPSYVEYTLYQSEVNVKNRRNSTFPSIRGLACAAASATVVILSVASSAYGHDDGVASVAADNTSTQHAAPPGLAPPAGHVLSSLFHAHGVQVYQCTAGTWTFLEPAASLTGRVKGAHRAGRHTAIHFRGPSWESTEDGSLIEAKVVASSPVPGSIPQLLLQATKNRGDGAFGRVTYVQRLATSGGVAPTGACTDGRSAGVVYRAEYRFFVAAT